jgi:hypothetical protein
MPYRSKQVLSKENILQPKNNQKENQKKSMIRL